MKPHDYKIAEEILRSASANIDVPLDKWPHYAVENLFHLAHDLFAKVKQQDAENATLRHALEKIAKGFGGRPAVAAAAENAYREKVACKALSYTQPGIKDPKPGVSIPQRVQTEKK